MPSKPLDRAPLSSDAFLRAVARSPTREPDAPLKGSRIGRYTLEEPIGRGGMGIVLAARDELLDRRVALKLLPADALGNAERRARFLREAKAIAAAAGPNIATIYDAGEEDGQVFLAMELLTGPTLRAHLARARPPMAEAIRVARGLARGLSGAHAAGVIHRDLKPDNVMLDEDGEPRILDFGLAKRELGSEATDAASTELRTEQGRLLGTPAYMAPEQFKLREVSARSDVFSLGVMLYELLTGRRPFVGETTIELLISIDRDDPTPIAALLPGAPPALGALVSRCLEKRPEDRPSSAEVFAALTDLSNDLSVGASEPARRPIAAAAPLPVSQVPAAVEAYRAGLAARRTTATGVAHFTRALELDPTLGAAHVMLARRYFWRPNTESREHFRRAGDVVDRLSQRDRSLLRAMEPVLMRHPPDYDEASARFEQMLRDDPRDPDVWQGWMDVEMRTRTGSWPAVMKRAAAALPEDLGILCYGAWCDAFQGRVDEARAQIGAVLARAPLTPLAALIGAQLARERGNRAALEAHARQWLVAEPEDTRAYPELADALAGAHQLGAARVVLEQKWARLPPGRVAHDRAVDEARLATLSGDLEAALGHARAATREVASSVWAWQHADAARREVLLLLELGRDDEAGAVAEVYLARCAAWEIDPECEDAAIARNATPDLLAAAARARRATTGGDALEAWNAELLTRACAGFERNVWLHGRAFPAAILGTRESADAALATLAAAGGPPLYAPECLGPYAVGAVHLHAGRAAEAIAPLEAATRSVRAFTDAVQHTQAFLLLGEARERTGDVAGALEAYRVVVSRWGRAPASVSAQRARARIVALRG